MKNDEKALRQIAAKKEKLLHIIDSDYPINRRLHEAHTRKVKHAQKFLKEFEEIEPLLEGAFNINIVPRPTFEKQIKKADFCTMEFDGVYCRIAVVQNYPFDNLWLIYTASLGTL